ncbi:MAG: hypothetical protein COA50_03265 [Flavobacteriaceae bacterium]|nr:MAG: hypothetical protein COA50_03265 [Flavobacteriaceae bacterium]
MPYFQKSFFVKTSFFCLLLFLCNGCIDPVSPEFEFKEGLIFVEGFVSTSQGASFVAITESALEFGVYVTNFMEGASVAFINSTSGEVVPLMEQGESYVPPANFIASIGDTWEVEIILPNGTQYRSEPETIDAPVAIKGIEARYNPELLFREASGKYTPGHQVLVSFDDPSNRENYYY